MVYFANRVLNGLSLCCCKKQQPWKNLFWSQSYLKWCCVCVESSRSWRGCLEDVYQEVMMMKTFPAPTAEHAQTPRWTVNPFSLWMPLKGLKPQLSFCLWQLTLPPPPCGTQLNASEPAVSSGGLFSFHLCLSKPGFLDPASPAVTRQSWQALKEINAASQNRFSNGSAHVGVWHNRHVSFSRGGVVRTLLHELSHSTAGVGGESEGRSFEGAPHKL